MLSLKAQYFLSFAVMGSLLPFLPVYLQERGLDLAQIGYVGAVASAAVLLAPVSATLLADGTISGKRLLGVIFAASGAALAALALAQSFGAIVLLFGVYSLTFAATTSLQDGLNFLTQQQRQQQRMPIVPYHRVRVWGTVGFIVPSLIMFEFFRRGYSIQLIMLLAATFCGLGMLNCLALPRPLANLTAQAPPSGKQQHRRLPTLAAARAMLEPHVLVFCLAMLLVHMATAAYYMFFPVYLKNHVGLDDQWLGLVATLGVTVEIFFMLGFGRLLDALGLKRLMVIGVMCMVLRLALLASSSALAVAVGTQLLHGIMVLVVHVAPPIFLNRHAQDTYRNSMQGLYVMTIYGTGRIAGNLIAGHVAAVNLAWVFAGSAALCGLAATLLAFAFHDRPRHVET